MLLLTCYISYLLAKIMTHGAFASGNMTETQDADFCIILWPKSWVDCCILSVPGNEHREDLADC